MGGPARCQHPPGLQTRSPPADFRTPRSSACATVLIAGIGFRALALPPFFGQPCRISSASLVGDRPLRRPWSLPCRGLSACAVSLPTNLKYTCLPVLREDIAAPPPFAAGLSGSGQFFAAFSGFRAVSLRCLPVFTGFSAVLSGLTRFLFGFLCALIGFLPQKAKSPAANTPLPWSFSPEYILFSLDPDQKNPPPCGGGSVFILILQLPVFCARVPGYAPRPAFASC